VGIVVTILVPAASSFTRMVHSGDSVMADDFDEAVWLFAWIAGVGIPAHSCCFNGCVECVLKIIRKPQLVATYMLVGLRAIFLRLPSQNIKLCHRRKGV
jgi:hypothetical protein